ncbi:MAG: orotidine-5'-phosphate decarboxylase [Mycobacteriaceae bacterium]
MTRATFGQRLAAAVTARGPLCVGIDPHPALLAGWGLSDDVAGLERFAPVCVAALAGEVAVLKPQVAFFEAHGSAGLAVLERTITAAQQAGALVLADAKRGDIGSTMSAYARAWLSEDSPLAVDAVTLSPYLGVGALAPALTLAAENGRGVFVLALTSNPEGAAVQRAVGRGGNGAGAGNGAGTTVAQAVVDELAARNVGATPMGSAGVVVGATVSSPFLDLSRLNGPVLAPGFGAQGAGVADLVRVFGRERTHVLATSSRDVLRHGPDVASLRSAAARVRDELLAPR